MPAARVGDMHVCPMVTPGVPPIPHVGGPILPPGGITVLIGGMPAARVGDMAVCVGPPDVIALGSFTVLIGGMPAARHGRPDRPRRQHRPGLSDRADQLTLPIGSMSNPFHCLAARSPGHAHQAGIRRNQADRGPRRQPRSPRRNAEGPVRIGVIGDFRGRGNPDFRVTSDQLRRKHG